MFNELGKCWGIIIGAHNDIPGKIGVHTLPDPKKLPGSEKHEEIPLSEKELKKKKRKDKKKADKRRKKEKKKKTKQKLLDSEKNEVPESPPS